MTRSHNVAQTVIVIALAAAVVLLALNLGGRSTSSGSSSSSAGPQALEADSFTTSYPAGWQMVEQRNATGAARYQLSSTGEKISDLGIGPTGTIGVTVMEMPISETAAADKSAVALLPQVIGVPREAQGVSRVVTPRATSLDGANAAEEEYTYDYAGRRIVQVDVLSRTGERLAWVELDAESRQAAAGQEALQALTEHWRWH